ncbi:bifunctional folylpolyglutamate synthase/dihydrofolate synthase [Capnocytophaga canimorsus]|uniref:bifunctional folylpolyglutamate synthase/dihydrofolate synthase n=1 Tax=Capnocytophaga canimorsus TaxID=28188 RepID=UPI000D6E3EC8|nr:folylpolyglutamate synthase/dihydrofolate synthase family protein [Capnocytophaga canimorsus]AWL78205.1 tetrahydrofolate synthase [Capnocytophaga canimorsus]AYW36838.1 bifunctional folylpolyglutamate synthase/dihydrofolate synthase [Capnocytophaga canimorsus]MDT9499532.1 bifunctional folylpolyglutamate synthase/dihydrofolate synthase [Capnocytophaga canimorsus]
MNYKETLAWMFNRLPMYQNKGREALNHKLDNIRLLSERLGNPHQQFKSIHVAGTNGKGSSSHMLASVLQQAGYRVGLYTSPHLRDFRERIKINGVEISEQYVVDFVARHQSFFESTFLSFFEMTVGLAFEYFASENVDIAVIEVGLGGRFDSTNIITPQVSLITNISKDHTDILGHTLAEIAFEKAGIIKQGIPVVISENDQQTAVVFVNQAQEKQAPITFASTLSCNYITDLQGIYQAKNIKGVVAVLEILKNKGWKITSGNITLGLQNVVKNTGLKGRWQTLSETPKIICDTAHNLAGLSLVMQQLQNQQFEKLHIVLGFVKDKDVQQVLEVFPKSATYYFCSPAIPRGLEVETLKALAETKGLQGQAYPSVQKALEKAKENAHPSDFIFVGGSTFVVAEVV